MKVQKELGDAVGRDVFMYSITLDPMRDAPEVLKKYAKDNGYTLILDVNPQQSMVVYASNTIDVTKAIIDLYDKNTVSAPAGTPAPATPAPPKPAPPKPTTPSGKPGPGN